jgi:hypothetical protein
VSLFRYNPEIHDNPEFHDRRHGYDPNQPRVPAGHDDGGQWTRGAYGADAGVPRDDANAPPVRLAFVPVLGAAVAGAAETTAGVAAAAAIARAAAAVVGFAAGVFTARSQRESTDQQPAFEFRAYRFTKYGDDPNGKIDFSATTRVSPQEIEQNCRAVADVQGYTDKAAEAVNARELKERKRLSNREYGTAVHKDTKDQVDDLKLTGRNPYDLSAERTFLKGAPETYGTKDAVRVDIWEPRRDIKTICLYDPKTGDSPRTIISPARAAELAEHSFAKGYTRLYIIEIRPTVERNPPFR